MPLLTGAQRAEYNARMPESSPSSRLDPARLRPLLGALAGRFDVDALSECDSTNSELMRRAERGAPSGSVLVADRQHAGRGRRGRQWSSSPENSLTFSLLWRFAPPLERLAGLSLAVGLALAQGLEKLGARQVRLKWPNDLLLQTSNTGEAAGKLGGILVEMALDRRGAAAIIGIGLNLAAPDNIEGQAVAGLDSALGTAAPPERHALLAALLIELAGVLDQFDTAGFGPLAEAWSARHAWQNQAVRILEDGQTLLEGCCLGCDHDGALLLQLADGTRQRVLAGDVSLRPLFNDAPTRNGSP